MPKVQVADKIRFHLFIASRHPLIQPHEPRHAGSFVGLFDRHTYSVSYTYSSGVLYDLDNLFVQHYVLPKNLIIIMIMAEKPVLKRNPLTDLFQILSESVLI